MAYIVDRVDGPGRCVHLKDERTGGDFKIIRLDSGDWTGYEDEIQVVATDTSAVVTLKNGSIKQFDLTKGNVGVEI